MQPDPQGFSLIYVTCPDEETARMISHKAIEAEVAACANIVSGMSAIYPWEGKIAQEGEVVLLLKTASDAVHEAMALVERHHPYDVPAILEIPLGRVSEPYKKWLEETLRK